MAKQKFFMRIGERRFIYQHTPKDSERFHSGENPHERSPSPRKKETLPRGVDNYFVRPEDLVVKAREEASQNLEKVQAKLERAEDPRRIVAANERLLANINGNFGLKLNLDTLKQVVGFLPAIDEATNQRNLVEDIRRLQKDVGVKSDGKFGAETLLAFLNYSGSNRDLLGRLATLMAKIYADGVNITRLRKQLDNHVTKQKGEKIKKEIKERIDAGMSLVDIKNYVGERFGIPAEEFSRNPGLSSSRFTVAPDAFAESLASIITGKETLVAKTPAPAPTVAKEIKIPRPELLSGVYQRGYETAMEDFRALLRDVEQSKYTLRMHHTLAGKIDKILVDIGLTASEKPHPNEVAAEIKKLAESNDVRRFDGLLYRVLDKVALALQEKQEAHQPLRLAIETRRS